MRWGTLKRDMLELGKPGTRRADICQTRVKDTIPTDVAYACRYWAWHLSTGGESVRDGDLTHKFLSSHFFHWLEALAWLDQLPSAFTFVNQLRSVVQLGGVKESGGPGSKVDKLTPDGQGDQLIAFIDDARSWMIEHRFVALVAPLQLYYCAWTYTSPQSAVRQAMTSHGDGWTEAFSPIEVQRGVTGRSSQGHDDWVTALAVHPDGLHMVSASCDKSLRLWNVRTGKMERIYEGHYDWVKSVAFSESGDRMVSGSNDRTVRVWETVSGHEVLRLLGHKDWVTSVDYSPCHTAVASASEDSMIYLWNVDTGVQTRKLGGHQCRVLSLSYSPDGHSIASASADRTIRLWNTSNGDETLKIEGHDDWVKCVTFSPDGRSLASASCDKTVRLWDARTGQQKQVLRGHKSWVVYTAYSPKGDLLVSASEDGTVRIWDVESNLGDVKGILEGHKGYVNGARFSHDGDFVATVSNDHSVRLWDVTTATEVKKLPVENFGAAISSLIFSHDGTIVMSVSGDDTKRLWDVATGKELPHSRDPSVQSTAAANANASAADQPSFEIDGHLFAPARTTARIRLDGNWMEYNNQPLLSLPHEYVRTCSAAYENTLAIGHESGAVTIFQCPSLWN